MTRGYSRKEDGHGWIEIRLQNCTAAAASQVLLHLRQLDRDNFLLEDAERIFRVALIHSRSAVTLPSP